MTQEELVKIAIDIIIHGKDNNSYGWSISLNKDEIWFFGFGGLYYRAHHLTDNSYDIYFDKTVKNMAMLCVLFRDWCIRIDDIFCYERWIKLGTKE